MSRPDLLTPSAFSDEDMAALEAAYALHELWLVRDNLAAHFVGRPLLTRSSSGPRR